MEIFSRILVPTDFSACSSKAVDIAAKLAMQHGDQVHLMHVVELPEFLLESAGTADALCQLLEETAAKTMAREVERLRSLGVPGDFVTLRDSDASRAILGQAWTHEIKLIIMGTHGCRTADQLLMGGRFEFGRSPLALRVDADRLLTGSTTERVIQLAPCSVMTMGHHDHCFEHGIKKILVGIDFSADSWRALVAGTQLVTRQGGSLELLHVIERAHRPDFYPEELGRSIPSLTELEAIVPERLAEFWSMASGSPGGPVNCHVRYGHPSEEILRFAEEQEIDLIIQGAAGLSRTVPDLLGSVAEDIVRSAFCPVLTIRRSPSAGRHRSHKSEQGDSERVARSRD